MIYHKREGIIAEWTHLSSTEGVEIETLEDKMIVKNHSSDTVEFILIEKKIEQLSVD